MPILCFNPSCLKDIPRAEVKRCARCRMTTYCSPECQRNAWRAGHRETCAPRDGLVRGPDGALRLPAVGSPGWATLALGARLNRWLQHWRPVLVHGAVMGLDLANAPDSAETHCTIISISPNETPGHSKLRDFEIECGLIVPIAEMRRVVPTFTVRSYGTGSMTTITILLHVAAPDGVAVAPRTMRFGLRNALQLKAMDKGESTRMALRWGIWLTSMVHEKTPEEALDPTGRVPAQMDPDPYV